MPKTKTIGYNFRSMWSEMYLGWLRYRGWAVVDVRDRPSICGHLAYVDLEKRN